MYIDLDFVYRISKVDILVLIRVQTVLILDLGLMYAFYVLPYAVFFVIRILICWFPSPDRDRHVGVFRYLFELGLVCI